MKTLLLLVVTTAYIWGRTSAASSSLPFLPDAAASSSSRRLSSSTNCPHDCFHNGACNSVDGDDGKPEYYCDCDADFGGRYCESAKVECDRDNMYCLNGGRCVVVTTDDGERVVGCNCSGLEGEAGGPFLGTHCESHPSMFCTGSNSGIFSSHSFCTNGGTCNQINVSGDSHHHGCQCQGDYTNGIYCEYEEGYLPLMIHTLPPPETIEEFIDHPSPDVSESGKMVQTENPLQTSNSGEESTSKRSKHIFTSVLLVAGVSVAFVAIVRANARRLSQPDTFQNANFGDDDSPGAFVMGDLALSPSGPRMMPPTDGGDDGGEII